MNYPYRVPVYLQLLPDGRTWSGHPTVRRITNSRPDDPIPGALIVKVTLNIPREAFAPIEPSASVDIDLDLATRTPTVTQEQA